MRSSPRPCPSSCASGFSLAPRSRGSPIRCPARATRSRRARLPSNSTTALPKPFSRATPSGRPALRSADLSGSKTSAPSRSVTASPRAILRRRAARTYRKCSTSIRPRRARKLRKALSSARSQTSQATPTAMTARSPSALPKPSTSSSKCPEPSATSIRTAASPSTCA